MRISRRQVVAGFGAVGVLGLSACGGGSAPVARQGFQPVPNAGFDAWLRGFRGRAVAAGISPGIADRGIAKAGYLPDVIERDRNQVEFKRSFEDYLAITASPERVAKGREMYGRHRATLDAIEARYGVPSQIVTAVWGIESRYGERRGTIPVISSTATLAYDGRRGAFFEKQLIAALRILQNGDTTPDRMVGSWAGAMGHTQFIPTSYEAFAVDFTGDGRRDIWSDSPADALASTAAYLQRNGWRKGQPWVVEALPGTSGGTVIQPQSPGPQFRTYHNFNVIKRYNNSDSYALAVGYLANRIAGGAPLQTSFGPDANGLTLEDRKALQQGLTRAGYDTGGSDGVIGPKSQGAIRDFQRDKGLPVTGTPSPALLAMLR
ncbi:MAG: lytic murein transglycosylase [Marinibacterium sp.]|nr:lytic murein transglycosylase [Marinibacterium sp.]